MPNEIKDDFFNNFGFDTKLTDEDTVTGTEVETLESANDQAIIFLTALKEECTEDEYNKLVTENATELATYGLIEKPEVVTESLKNIVKLNKFAKLAATHKITAIKLAKANKDPNYVKYKKFRKLMVEARNKIYTKYDSRALSLARKTLANSKHKASMMKGPAGRDITSKLQSHIEKLDRNGRNFSAVNDKKEA